MKDSAKNWAAYAKAACTERGRLGALMAALNESPKVLDLTLLNLGLSNTRQVLEFCWAAEKADRSWMTKNKLALDRDSA